MRKKIYNTKKTGKTRNKQVMLGRFNRQVILMMDQSYVQE